MQVSAEQLSSQLQKQLLPVYVVSGDEPLLQQECCDLIRQSARQQGCTEREIIDTSLAGFNWQDILHSAANMSLFAERKLVELRLPGGKPGADGSKALCEYLTLASEDDVLLVISGKIDKQSLSSKWYKSLDRVGVTIRVWPIAARELPAWLRQRVQSAGLTIDNDALELLCDRVEGNLLAAVQEVEKLKLLTTDNHVNVRTVSASVSDNSRFDIFNLADSALTGNATTSLRILHVLRAEGTEPTLVLWALTREVRTLYQVQLDCDQGQGVQQALTSRRVWNNRMSLMRSALSRHDANSLSQLLEQAAAVDGSIKGFGVGRAWDNLETLTLNLCRGTPRQ